VFAALTSSTASIDSTNSAIDSSDASTFYIQMAKLAAYDISTTETVLVTVPAATAGAASATITGAFEPTFGTAQGILLKILAFKITSSLSTPVSVIGEAFDVVISYKTTGWTAAASPDPSGAYAEAGVSTIPLTELVTGTASSGSAHRMSAQAAGLVVDRVSRLGGETKLAGTGGKIIYSNIRFINASECADPCVTFGVRNSIHNELIWDANNFNATSLTGGVIRTISENWAIGFTTPLSSIVIGASVPLFVTLMNGDIAPLPGKYKLTATVVVGVDTVYSNTIDVATSTVNFGLMKVALNSTVEQIGTLKFALTTANGATVPTSSKDSTPVSSSYTIKIIPANFPNYKIADPAVADVAFDLEFVNLASAVGLQAVIIDVASSCGAVNARRYANATVSATFMGRFTIPLYGNTFPISAQVCVNGTAVGGLLTVTGTVMPTYTLDELLVLGEPRTITLDMKATIASGLSFFWSNVSGSCDLANAVAFDNSLPAPLTSIQTDGKFTFTLSEAVDADKVYACVRPAGGNWTSLVVGETITLGESDGVDTTMTIKQGEPFTIRLTTKRGLGVRAITQVAMVNKGTGFSSCEAFKRTLPSTYILKTFDNNPTFMDSRGLSYFGQFWKNLFYNNQEAFYTFTPAVQTQAAGFCGRHSNYGIWRTLTFADGSTTVRVVGAPRYQLVNADYAQLGVQLVLALSLPTSSSSSTAYITAQGHCQSPPTLSNSSDALTSGLFVGVQKAATSGLSVSVEGVVTLIVPSARLPTMPAENVNLCLSQGGAFTMVQREGNTVSFELRAGNPAFLVISHSGESPCKLEAVQQKMYQLPQFAITVKDNQNRTVISASGTITLSVLCYDQLGNANTGCSLLGSTQLTIQPATHGVVVSDFLYVSGVAFGGSFAVRASMANVQADVLKRDTTCNGTLQFSQVGELTFGGTIMSGFNIPDKTAGFTGANLVIKIADDSFAFDMCTNTAKQTAVLQGITSTSANGTRRNGQSLFTFRAAACSESSITLDLNQAYQPMGIETWSINITKDLTLRQTTPRFALASNEFSLSPSCTPILTPPASATENMIAYQTGFKFSVSLPAGFSYVDPGTFSSMQSAIIAGITSVAPSSSASTFQSIRQYLIPTKNVVRTSDTQMTITIAPNANYAVMGPDTIQVVLPKGLIASYARAELVGNFTITQSPTASNLTISIPNLQVLKPGENFSVMAQVIDANGSVVPLAGSLRVASTVPVFGDQIAIVSGMGSGNLNVRSIGTFTLTFTLAELALPPVSMNVTTELILSPESSVIAPSFPIPGSIAPGMPFDLALQVKDAFGNPFKDGTVFKLQVTGATISASGSSMRRLLQTSTAAPTAAPTTPAPPQTSSVSTGVKNGEVSFKGLTITGNGRVTMQLIGPDGKTYFSAPATVSSDLVSFVGAFPANGTVFAAGVNATLNVAVYVGGQPVVGQSVTFTPITSAGRISSSYVRTVTTDAKGIARMLLQFPVAGNYTFMAMVNTTVVQSAVIPVPAGPPASISVVSQPTPTIDASVSAGETFTIMLNAYDANGNFASNSNVGLVYTAQMPATGGSLASEPVGAMIVNGVASLSYSVMCPARTASRFASLARLT